RRGLGRGDGLWLAVHRHRARMDEPRDTMFDACRDYVQRPGDVRTQVALRVRKGLRNARLAGNVEHRLEAASLERLLERRRIGDVSLDELGLGGDVLPRSVAQVVDDDDV